MPYRAFITDSVHSFSRTSLRPFAISSLACDTDGFSAQGPTGGTWPAMDWVIYSSIRPKRQGNYGFEPASFRLRQRRHGYQTCTYCTDNLDHLATSSSLTKVTLIKVHSADQSFCSWVSRSWLLKSSLRWFDSYRRTCGRNGQVFRERLLRVVITKSWVILNGALQIFLTTLPDSSRGKTVELLVMLIFLKRARPCSWAPTYEWKHLV